MSEGWQELKAAFDDWFTGLLLSQESCLLRDVLRQNKVYLEHTFYRLKPIITSDEEPKPQTGGAEK